MHDDRHFHWGARRARTIVVLALVCGVVVAGSQALFRAVKGQATATLIKSVDAVQAQQGDVLTYTIEYRSAGSFDASNVSIADILPAGVTYVQGSATGNPTFANQTLTWSYPQVAAGQSVSVAFQVNLTPPIDTSPDGGGGPPAGSAATFVTHHDIIPNFYSHPTIATRQSGAWSSAATWEGGNIPGGRDVVHIRPEHTVIYDAVSDAALAVVGVEGLLRFRTDVSTRMKVGTLQVGPSGTLEIGTAGSPVPPHLTAEIIIANRPLATTSPDPDTGVVDPRQFGTGLLVLGKIDVHGAPKTPSWTRVTVEPLAGQTTLSLAQSVSGWRVGDIVVLPDTRHLPIDHKDHFDDYPFVSQTERLVISAISADGRQVTLGSPLHYDHRGPRDPDGTPSVFQDVRLLPHVGNVSRNVIIRSDAPDGTRGHGMFTDRARVNIHAAGFYDLARTTIDALHSAQFDGQGNATRIGNNQIGRYAVHFHHLWGPPRQMSSSFSSDQIRAWLEQQGWQYVFIGNAVGGGDVQPRLPKWGVTIHNAHFGKVTDNVIFNVAGAGVMAEDASESYNLIARNFAVMINGSGRARIPSLTGDQDHWGDVGKDGSGFWYRGSHNWMEGNVAADTTFSSHYLSSYYIKENYVPLFPGADPHASGEGKFMRLRPLLSFTDQEGYGTTQIGLYGAWVLGCCGPSNWPEMRVQNLAVWHAYIAGTFWYHNGRATFDHAFFRGDSTVTARPDFKGRQMNSIGMDFTDYQNVELAVQQSDIRGFNVGIDGPNDISGSGSSPPTLFRDTVLQNFTNLITHQPATEINITALSMP